MDWAIEIINNLANLNFSVALLVSFLVGLLSFDPCMLGMASSLLAFQNNSKGKRILPITLTFVFSFIITFILLGVVSLYFGEQVLRWSQQYNHLLNSLLAVLFILLGCYILGIKFRHFFGWLPFKIIFFYSKQAKHKTPEFKNPLMKAFSFGSLFGLMPNPCTAPMILAAIAYYSVTHSMALSIFLLFAYGIGHSIPFLIVGWMTGALNHSGWMERWHQVINKVIGIGLVLIAVLLFFE